MVKRAFARRSGIVQRCPLSLLLFNTVLRVLSITIRQKKEIRIQTVKEEIKLLLFANDMILHVEYPKDIIKKKKILELIN